MWGPLTQPRAHPRLGRIFKQPDTLPERGIRAQLHLTRVVRDHSSVQENGTSRNHCGETGGLPFTLAVRDITITGCTGEFAVHVLGNGSMSVTSGGLLRGTGQTFNVTTPLGITCEFTTNSTILGIVEDSKATGGTAAANISASIPRTGGSFLCGSSGQSTEEYLVTATGGGSDRFYID